VKYSKGLGLKGVFIKLDGKNYKKVEVSPPKEIANINGWSVQC
jgi:hypothetical protein